jgi:hypothetical protein
MFLLVFLLTLEFKVNTVFERTRKPPDDRALIEGRSSPWIGIQEGGALFLWDRDYSSPRRAGLGWHSTLPSAPVIPLRERRQRGWPRRRRALDGSALGDSCGREYTVGALSRSSPSFRPSGREVLGVGLPSFPGWPERVRSRRPPQSLLMVGRDYSIRGASMKVIFMSPMG